MCDSLILRRSELVENTRGQLNPTVERTNESKGVDGQSHPGFSKYGIVVFSMSLERSGPVGGCDPTSSSYTSDLESVLTQNNFGSLILHVFESFLSIVSVVSISGLNLPNVILSRPCYDLMSDFLLSLGSGISRRSLFISSSLFIIINYNLC